MSLRSLLIASAAALSLAAAASSASACGLEANFPARVTDDMVVAQNTPLPAGATLTAPDLHSSLGDIHSAPAPQQPAVPAAAAAPAPAAAAAPAAQPADSQN